MSDTMLKRYTCAEFMDEVSKHKTSAAVTGDTIDHTPGKCTQHNYHSGTLIPHIKNSSNIPSGI